MLKNDRCFSIISILSIQNIFPRISLKVVKTKKNFTGEKDTKFSSSVS